MKKSQEQFVIDQLKLNGFVSRNLCLQERITRLGAIIWTLQHEKGWEFRGDYCKEKGGRNYYYYVVKSPLKVYNYKVEGLDKEIKVYA